ncbi:MAG: TonB-dependent receptor [Bryobacterales bacterium]|nr:TonB-dependent receptor [Bryobacterales bacterium]
MRTRIAVLTLLASATLAAQSTARLSGTVTMRESNEPLHGASVMITELGKSAFTDDEGHYEIDGIPPGTYTVLSHLDSLFTEASQKVTLASGAESTLNFTLAIHEQHYEVTVTAGDKPQTTFESFQSANSYDAYDLAQSPSASIGEALDQKVGTGIAKRSFGPGTSRPIIRGFDGDRVLIMQDGIRTGSLSSQSGDHGELINPAQLERLEVVKGPGTLLYSGNAMGGTVNAISRHHALHQHAHEGLRGFAQGSGGSNNGLGGGSAGFEYGYKKWMLWGQGGAVRTGDYSSPVGTIFNSRTRLANGGAGFGWFGDKHHFSFDLQSDDGDYGVPFAQEIEAHSDDESEGADDHEGEEEELDRIALQSSRQNYRFEYSVDNLSKAFSSFDLKLNYTDWTHKEVEFFEGGSSAVGTRFDQGQFIYRGVFQQAKRGILGGQFGFWGVRRNYKVTGEEALSPNVDQNGFAVFGLEEVELERVKFQFGGRLETNRYNPLSAIRGAAGEGVAPAIDRSFTGASAAAGMHLDLWKGGAFVTNYSHNYRAPSLEELYNYGPHVGNLAYEVGNPALNPETGNGIDVSLRHQAKRTRGELNLFYYSFSNFVFPFLTGEVADNLRVVEFTQRNARFTGSEAMVGLSPRENLWFNLGMDFVDAQDTDTNTPLPRIPPLRGKVGIDFSHGGFHIEPTLIVANAQQQTFTGETRTAGYAVVDLKASYTLASQHIGHQFSVDVFNMGDRLYRNHSSFIKDLAPEIGRGVKFTYMMRFF